ncbi:MAG: adenylate/guanylate cyclase domain-containing protein, partial [Bacteroidota bacterium]
RFLITFALMFHTFRHRLLFWFLVFISSSIVVIALSFAYIQQRESIFRNAELVDQSYVMLLKSVKAQQDFFSYETKNTTYFETSKSIYLDRYKELLDSTMSLLQKSKLPDEKRLEVALLEQQNSILATDSLFKILIAKIGERGFKDFNLEGDMRDDVHWLEESTILPIRDILSLRRHEKDYIIRNEKAYVNKLNQEVDRLKESIENRVFQDSSKKIEIFNRLEGYQEKFNKLVALDELIGIKDNTGLKRQLDGQIFDLETNFSDVVTATREWSRKAFDRLTLFFGITVVFLVIISIVISTLIARRITRPLTDLTNHITRFVDSNFTLETDHPVVRTKDEIGSLTQNFSVLKDEVISQMKFFKQKVEERTAELAAANKRLVRLSEANSRFVPDEFLNRLGKAGIEDVSLGDHVEQEMTVMFSDIRDFTSISEGLDPQENFDFINSYLNGIVPIIRNNGGFIDKFVGDSVMALFPGSPDGAIEAILGFEEFLKEFNQRLTKEGKKPIYIGTGLHTGNLILGTIGHDDRLETTVISDAVNTAARVEGLTKYYGAKAIFTEYTLSKVNKSEAFHYRFLDKVRVKGKSRTISIYELIHPENTKKVKSLESYNKALKKLRSNNVGEANSILEELKDKNPDDKGVELMLEKCKKHLSETDEAWDDETEMISK